MLGIYQNLRKNPKIQKQNLESVCISITEIELDQFNSKFDADSESEIRIPKKSKKIPKTPKKQKTRFLFRASTLLSRDQF